MQSERAERDLKYVKQYSSKSLRRQVVARPTALSASQESFTHTQLIVIAHRAKIHHRLFACPRSVRRNMLRRRQPGRPIWGRKVLEWFSQKTSIAGTQIPNWVIVVGAIIIILLILGRI
jgi:hypothetical protein